MSNKIDVAVIGLGEMGATHVGAARESQFVRHIYGVDAGADRTRKRAGELAIRAASLTQVLADPAVKLITIAASNDAHVPIAIDALRAGKAVMCEKPMGQSLAEARKLMQVREATGGFLQIGFELHYSTLYRKTKEYIQSGVIGEVVNIQNRYFCSEFHRRDNWRSNSTGSFLIGEKLSHYLDLQRWWFDRKVESVYAVSAPNVVDYFHHHDNHQIIAGFAGGGVGVLTFVMNFPETFHGDPLRDLVSQQMDDGHFLQYHIIGTKGAIETDVFRRRFRVWQFGSDPTGMESRIVESLSWTQAEDLVWFHNTHGQNLRIIELVAKGLPPDVPATDAYESMKFCFAAEKSSANGRVVKLNRWK